MQVVALARGYPEANPEAACMHARILIAKSAILIFTRTQYCVGSDEPKGAAPPECSEGPLYGVFPVCGARDREAGPVAPAFTDINLYHVTRVRDFTVK